jgi:hypothetical protein
VSENVLQEADRLTDQDRYDAYGPGPEDAERFAEIASAITGLEIEPEHYPLLMIAVKLSRQAHRYKRDNLVDIAGYCKLAEQIAEQ